MSKLRATRKRYGLTRAQAAKLAKVSKVAWLNWENGKRTPNEVCMGRIFRMFNGEVTPNDFYPVARWQRQLAKAAADGRAGRPYPWVGVAARLNS